MAAKKEMETIREKDGVRGLVPSRRFASHDKAYGAYLNNLDPRNRADVQFALESSTDARFRAFLDQLERKAFGKRVSLQAVAKGCGISLHEFNQWWQHASTQAAIAVAQTKSIAITEDMAEDARTKWANCERCDGLGFVAADEGLPMDTPGYRILRMIERKGEDPTPVYVRKCPNMCDQGRIKQVGDQFSREKTLEMAGLLNKKGAGGVTLIQNFGGQAMASAVPRMSAMTIDIDSEELQR